MSASRFAVIILAAGFSSRMKQLKPLLSLGDATITDHAVSTFQSLGIDVFLVVGYRKEEVISGIKKPEVTIVYNPEFEKGMLTSIQAGVRELGSNYQAFFLLPVDIPMVQAVTIQKIIDSSVTNPEKIIYPVHNGKRGHPPLIPASLAPGILAWKQEGGLKTYLRSHEEMAVNLAVSDSFILFDIDTPEDYKELLKHSPEY